MWSRPKAKTVMWALLTCLQGNMQMNGWLSQTRFNWLRKEQVATPLAQSLAHFVQVAADTPKLRSGNDG